MENELDLDNLTKDDFMEMAKYVAHVEAKNTKLLEELAESKAYLAATIQQRNSLNMKLQQLISEKVNTIDVTKFTTEIKTL